MKIFVTGGSGFIGTNLIQDYIDRKIDVLNFDIKKPRNKEHHSLWVEGDILDKDHLCNILTSYDPDYIVHLAARTDLDGKRIEDYSANFTGISNLIESIRDLLKLKRILFASSRLVCSIGYIPKDENDFAPSTLYGESKVLGEKLVRENKENIPCPWMIFRPTSIWGPWFDVPYKDFFMSVLGGRYVHPVNKKIMKSFGYVGNAIYMIDRLLFCDSKLINGKTYYLTDYPPIEVQDWAQRICSLAGRPEPHEVPLFLLRATAKLGDLLKLLGWNRVPLTSFRLDNLLTNMVYDTHEVQKICGTLPYDLNDGIGETLKWLNR